MTARARIRICTGVAIGVYVVGVCATGCRRDAEAAKGRLDGTAWTPPVAADAPLSQQTAVDAARHLLRFLHAHLQAIAHGRPDLAAQYRDRVARELAAHDDILGRYRAVAGRLAMPDDEAMRRVAESWAAIIAYYADGLSLDEARLGPVSGDTARAIVDAPARGPAGQAIIRIACLRDDDDRWRVAALEFAPQPPPATTAPAPERQP